MSKRLCPRIAGCIDMGKGSRRDNELPTWVGFQDERRSSMSFCSIHMVLTHQNIHVNNNSRS